MKSSSLRMALLLGMLLSPLAQAAPSTASDFNLKGLKEQVSLSKLKGQVVYLDFWASWCTPCRESFPWMSEMQKRYGKKGLKIIAINLDKEADKAQEFIAANHPDFTIAFDPEGATAEKYEVMGMPSSYLIDRHGKLHSSHVGFRSKDKADMEKSIAKLLSSK